MFSVLVEACLVFCLQNDLVVVTSVLCVLKWSSLVMPKLGLTMACSYVLELLVTVVFHLLLLRGDALLTH